MSSLTLPKSGSMRNGQLFQRPTLERPIDENDFSSLPTPHAGLGERGRDGVILNPKGQQDLQHVIAHLLPTPKAAQGGPDATKVRPSGAQGTTNLAGAVRDLLPTPLADKTAGYAQPKTDFQSLPNVAISLLPTPTVNDMGAGKDPQKWQEWTEEMRQKHGNGNGHGRSLEQEAVSLLPTPRAGNADPRNIHIYARPLEQPQNLENALARIGDSTSQPSEDGNTSSDDQHQNLQLWDATDDPA
jgi:hypothetical protein